MVLPIARNDIIFSVLFLACLILTGIEALRDEAICFVHFYVLTSRNYDSHSMDVW